MIKVKGSGWTQKLTVDYGGKGRGCVEVGALKRVDNYVIFAIGLLQIDFKRF